MISREDSVPLCLQQMKEIVMIKGKIVVPCSKVELRMNQYGVEENLFVLIYGADGKIIKRLVFAAQPDSTANLMIFQEHRTK